MKRRQGLAAEGSTLVWLPRAGCALLWTASGSELLCFSSFAFHLELRTAECLCHLVLVSVCVVTNRTKNHDRIAYVWQKKDLSDFGCFHFLFKINFFCSGVGATISDAVARSSIVLCNSVSADRIVIAASRLLRAVAAFVIPIVFCSWISEIVLEWLHEGCEINLSADFLHFGTSVFFVARRFRAVWSVGRKECSVKCEVWRNQWEVRSVKCGVWSVKCGVWSLSLECEERSVKCEVWGLECEGSSEKWEVWSVKCEVWSVKFEVWSAKSAVCSVKCEVWSVECEDFASSLAEKIKRLSREGHGRDRLSLNYRSFMFGKLPPPACPGLC